MYEIDCISTERIFFLHKAKLSYDVFIKFVYCFVNELRIIDVRYMLGLAQGTIVDYYNFFREVCFIDLLKKKEKIGGVGKTVEIDESMNRCLERENLIKEKE